VNETSLVETSITMLSGEPRNELTELRRASVAGFVFGLRLAAASTYGARQCFLEHSSATQITTSYAESSTQNRAMAPDLRVRLDAVLNAASREIIEDGMNNSITESLPALIEKDSMSVIPGLVSMIETDHMAPIIASEVLKELGRISNPESHPHRLWLLEHALNLPSPFIRDGAGLGLASLADPSALPYLRRAVEIEKVPQIRADLQLVIDELNELRDGAPAASR
jgi:hypothetical protein